MASISANRKSGKTVSFRFRTCVGRNENGKQIFRSTTWKKPEGLSKTRLESALQKAATEWEKSVRAEYSMAEKMPKTERDNTKVLLTTYIHEEWFPIRINNGELKPKTVAFYHDTVKNICHYFEGMHLCEVRPILIQQFLNYLRVERGMKQQTIHHHYRTLKMIFSFAMKQELILKNPMENVDPPRLEHREVDALSSEDISRFLLALQDCQADFRCMLLLFVTTGLRRGELLGLTWEDINEEMVTISVKHNVTYTPETGITVSTPKTSRSNRVIPLMTTVFEQLKEYKVFYTNQFGKDIQKAYVFPSKDAFSPRDPSAVTRHVKRFMKCNGFSDISPHDLRHTCASLLLQSGADIKSVQEIMGHCNASTTLNFYARSDLNQIKAATKKMEMAFNI